MKSTGMTRKIDELGRVVLPKELRKTLNISQDDDIEIFVSEGNIHLRKFAPYCIFCGESENIKSYESKNVCENCIHKLSSEVSSIESESEAELNKMKQMLTYKNKEINSLKLELGELQENVKHHKSTNNHKAELNEYKEKIEQLNTELFSKEYDIKKLEKTIKTQEENAEGLRNEINNLNDIIKSHEEDIKKEKEEKIQLEKDFKILEQQCKINALEQQIKNNNNETEKKSLISKLFSK